MLPGLRFLFAAVVLSLSMLVFGLGAAALLRASHDRFVSTPKIRSAPPPLLAQHAEPATPTLSLLRVEDPAAATDSALATATDAVAAESTLTPEDTQAAHSIAAAPSAQPEDLKQAEAPATTMAPPEAPVAPTSDSAAPAAVTASSPVEPSAAANPSESKASESKASESKASENNAAEAAATEVAPAAQPDAAAKSNDAPSVATLSEEAVPVPPRLPVARPVIRTSKPKARRVAHKRKHVVRRRVAVPTAAEQSFLPGFGGS
ncbi:hypothetical protein BJ122_102339 [Rhodopseudomonas faecalis]|uniref:Uncharacterized protein n=1 Tax=Rhodopseudomonas faecalis TaxID=99655 RepID=A0A318TL22_9BRAD|nr:hypothetical protein [Rhodopseudomonas faecalis]PYF05113.1 hypothetical protein BJ122_102339 [Rhodopseudomonas faecalis]